LEGWTLDEEDLGIRGGLLRRLHRLLTRALPVGAFSRAVAILASGIALAQIISLGTTPLLTRLYTPEDFGVLVVFTSVSVLWSTVTTLRYEYAIPLPKDSNVAANLLMVGASVLGIQVVAGFVVTLLLGPALCRALNVPELASWIWLLPISVLLGDTYGLLYMWALRQRAYGAIATTKVTQSIWRAALQSALGLFSLQPAGLLLGQMAGSAGGITRLWRIAADTSDGGFPRVDFSSARRAARRYARFATYGTASGLISGISRQITPLVFAYLFGTGVAGMFGLTQRVLAVPVGLVGVAISEAYLGVAPGLLREQPQELRRLFSRLTKRLLVIGMPPALVVMIAGPWLFSTIFGENWWDAGQYARFLAPAILMDFIVYPISQTANIFERQDLQSLADFACLAMLIAVFAAASGFGWSASATVIGVSGALCLYSGLCFMLYWWLLRRRSAGRDSANDSGLNDR
jgi:O-antigen/teichoic acid export membrane protein